MRLAPSPEQVAFAGVLHDLLAAAPAPDAEAGADRALWSRLADAGVTGLSVPERWGGLAATPADLVMAAEELGHHAVAGPVAESLAAVPALLGGLGDEGLCDKWLPELAAGRVVATLAAPPWLPYAADAHTADLVLLAEPGTVRLARIGTAYPSMDPARRLYEVTAGPVLATGPAVPAAVSHALDLGVLACAAQLLGAGRALLESAVGHVRSRVQFGRPIGEFQAVKHRLADVAVGLEFARPLLYAAAAALSGAGSPAAALSGAGSPVAALSGAGSPAAARDVSAAKVACAQAAHRAARAALQVHGAIGYTREHGLGRWLTKTRVLALAWGTPAQHRARVMAELAR